MGVLGVRCGGGGIRIMLETLNLVRKSHAYTGITHLENIPFSTRTPLILLMSAFDTKKLAFLANIRPLLKAIVHELC